MRPHCAGLALLAASLLSGCGFVHFGRREKAPVAGSDAALVTAHANLSTEHKILRQELVLARREGDALRLALERAGSGAPATEAAARLAETQRELAELRTRFSRLQAERAPPARTPAPAPAGPPPDPDNLRAENSRLRADLDRARLENATLAEKLHAAEVRYATARQDVDSLNGELLAEKQARSRAEKTTETLRAQLDAVIARPPPATPALPLSAARETTATSTATLVFPVASPAAPTSNLPAPARTGPRPPEHVVQPGDTLEKIALKYYGATEQWRTLHEANRAVLADGLRAGLVLRLP